MGLQASLTTTTIGSTKDFDSGIGRSRNSSMSGSGCMNHCSSKLLVWLPVQVLMLPSCDLPLPMSILRALVPFNLDLHALPDEQDKFARP